MKDKRILLIPGYSNTKLVFSKLIGYLEKFGATVEVLEHSIEEAKTLSEYAKKIKEKISNPTYDLVLGYSFGGGLAVALSPYLDCKKYILVNPYLGNDTLSQIILDSINLLERIYKLTKSYLLVKIIFIFMNLKGGLRRIKEILSYPSKLLVDIALIIRDSDIDLKEYLKKDKKFYVVSGIKDETISFKKLIENEKVDVPYLGMHHFPNDAAVLYYINTILNEK